jgi:hypothetical protein
MEFIKYSMNDLFVIWSDPQDYIQDGERTLYCEVFLQQFKLFAKMTKLLKFKWVEKKQCGIDDAWLQKNDYSRKGVQVKLLDDIGLLKKERFQLHYDRIFRVSC